MKLLGKRETIYDTTTFARQDCIHCGIVFYWPGELDRRARNEKRLFYCPGCGGNMIYDEGEADRLKKQLEEERERVIGLRSENARQREHRQAAERRVRAMKGVVTRTKNRVAKGKCVRCSCVFPDLAAHMATEHPGYAPDADDA